MNGSWIEYYSSTGRKKQEQTYQNGVEILRRGWWPNGMKRFEVGFVDGVEKSRTLWDQEGKPVGKSVSPAQTGKHDQPNQGLRRPPTRPSVVTSRKAPAPAKSVEQSERDRILKLRQENRQRRSGLRKPAIPTRPPADN